MRRHLATALFSSFLIVLMALPAWAGRKAEQPNLVVEQVAMSPSSGKAGSTLTADISVRNAGTASACSYRVGLYLSLDTTLSPGTLDPLIGSSQFLVLAAGALYPPGGNQFSISGTIPADTSPGPYYVFVFIDYTNAVAESAEDNNTTRFSYTVLPYQCAGLLATNPSVCSGHWICVADDTCSCEAVWGGATCSVSPTLRAAEPMPIAAARISVSAIQATR